ncbi:hypothetical protein VaNZ11_002722, partial [Volvox africanus]
RVEMYQLLQGYASSDDDDATSSHQGQDETVANTLTANHDFYEDDIINKRNQNCGSGLRSSRCPITKRPKLESGLQLTALTRVLPQSTPAPAHMTEPTALRTALPNPLTLLEAPSTEASQDLLATAAEPSLLLTSALPGPPRVRTFPHVIGNFPTVVLLPVPGMDDALDAVYRRIRRLLPDLEPMTHDPPPESAGTGPGPYCRTGERSVRGGKQESPGPHVLQVTTVQPHRGYHISLSRTVAIRHPQIAPLTALLVERLKVIGSCFQVALAGLRSFTNDEGSRSFVSVMVTHGSSQICSMISQVDTVFQQHGLPAFHE